MRIAHLSAPIAATMASATSRPNRMRFSTLPPYSSVRSLLCVWKNWSTRYPLAAFTSTIHMQRCEHHISPPAIKLRRELTTVKAGRHRVTSRGSKVLNVLLDLFCGQRARPWHAGPCSRTRTDVLDPFGVRRFRLGTTTERP